VIELYVIAAGLVTLAVLSVFVVLSSRVRLRIVRTVNPTRVFVDESAKVELRVHNAAWRTSPVVRLSDPVAGTIGATLSVAPLRPRHDAVAAYRLPSERRGHVQIGPMRMERRDPFGLAARRSTIAGVTEVLVYPRWQLLDFPDRWNGAGPLSQLMRRRMLARNTDEFHSLRNYAPGDDLRRVHWKQSARSEDLKIKETDPTAVQRMAVLLDVDASRYDAQSFEEAVSAAASFALSADRAGFKVHASTNAASTAASEDLEEYLETLALAVPLTGSRPLTSAVADVARWLEGGMVVVVTGRSNPDAFGAIRNAAPGSDAGVLVVCDPASAALVGNGQTRGGFLLDASSPGALQQGWQRLMGAHAPARRPPGAAP
jgi:uncharacterized protein (DUF58 family)